MHNPSCENEFYFHENEKSFSYQRLRTQPRFDTEARGNLEMIYGQISWTTGFLSDFHYCANDQKNKYYISLSQTSPWCLARGLWVCVAEPAIREAHKRVQTNIDKNTLNNLTEQYFYDIKRSFPIFVKYFI